jgi:FG-GAP repeat
VHRYGLVAAVAGCSGGLPSGGDFNGDGTRDTVISDPMVTLDGVWAAGVVHVVDGVTGAYRTLDERLPEVPGEIASGDRFGWSTAVYDANADRCADLVVGVPKKDVAGQTDAGVVYVFFGTPAGVGKGPVLNWEQGVNGVPGTSSAYDNFGYALSAGQYSNEPFLIVGAPGEDAAGKSDSGRITYIRSGYKVSFSADDAGGIGGGSEWDDRMGEAIASTPYQFAVAFPGEDVDGMANAGRVCVFSHIIQSSAYAAPIGCVDQGAGMEPGDSFGMSIAMAPYRKPGTSSTTDSVLVVGASGEDSGTGTVHQYHVTGLSVAEIPNSRTSGTAAGDLYGQKVYVQNTTTTAVESTDQTLILAVGIPGTANASIVDVGGVRVLPATKNTALAYDVRIGRRAGSLPGPAVAHELVGMHLGGTPTLLLVPSPYSGWQAVYGIEWAKLVTGSSEVKTTWPAPSAGPVAEAFGAQVG